METLNELKAAGLFKYVWLFLLSGIKGLTYPFLWTFTPSYSCFSDIYIYSKNYFFWDNTKISLRSEPLCSYWRFLRRKNCISVIKMWLKPILKSLYTNILLFLESVFKKIKTWNTRLSKNIISLPGYTQKPWRSWIN